MVSPEKVIKVGAVQASIFQNQVEKNGKTYNSPKVLVQVRFKKDNQWSGTSSLGLADIPKAILALQKAFEFLAIKADPEKDPEPEF